WGKSTLASGRLRGRGSCRAFFTGSAGTSPSQPRTGVLLADGNELHDLYFLTAHVLVDVGDDPGIALDDDLIMALDLLAAQRAAFLRGGDEFLAGGVAGAQGMGNLATQTADLHGRELLLSLVIAPQSHALKGIAGVLALDGFLDESA